MIKWKSFASIALLSGMALPAMACDPECVIASYLKSDTLGDFETAYSLISRDAGVNRADFMVRAADAFHAQGEIPDRVMSFLGDHHEVTANLRNALPGIAIYDVRDSKLDVVMTAVEWGGDVGSGENTWSWWPMFEDYVQEHGYLTHDTEFTFHLIEEDGQWKIAKTDPLNLLYLNNEFERTMNRRQ